MTDNIDHLPQAILKVWWSKGINISDVEEV